MTCPRCGTETNDWPCPNCGFPVIQKHFVKTAKERAVIYKSSPAKKIKSI